MSAILAKKIGMTQIITPEGRLVPCTVMEAGPCTITGVMTEDKNGYKAAQLGFGDVKEKRLTKALRGALSKRKLPLKRWLREFRLAPQEIYEVGQEIKADVFKAGDLVDVQGTSIGKGFAGGVKRWHWKGGPASHGSMFHRRIGSAGASSFPSRTWPGHHMPGRLGNARCTIQNLEVLKVDAALNLMVLKGSVPGGDNGLVFIKTSLKRPQGVKPKLQTKVKEKKDPLKASKQAAAGKKK